MGAFDFVNPAAPSGLDPAAQPPAAATAPGQPSAQPTAAPTVNPAQMEQRKSGWREFLTKMQTDPDTQAQLMQAGITMLQGQRPRENFNGLVGRSLQSSALTGHFLNQNRIQQDQGQQKIDLEQQRNDASTGASGAAVRASDEKVATSRQARDLAIAQHPLLLKKTEAELRKLEGEAKVAGLDLASYVKDKKIERERIGSETKANLSLAGQRDKTPGTRAQSADELVLNALKNLDPKSADAEFIKYKKGAMTSKLMSAVLGNVLSDQSAVDTANRFVNAQGGIVPVGGVGKIGAESNPHPTPKTEAERIAIPRGEYYMHPNGQAVPKQ